MISVVIPTLNDEAALQRTMAPLVRAAMDGLVREVVVADGGSTDETLALAEDAGAVIVGTARGRGVQLAAGCKAARGEWLLILHPGSELAEDWAQAAADHMARHPSDAACFRPASLMAGLFGPRGEQGLLIPRRLYEEVGGYRPVSREDVDLTRRLRGRLHRLPAKIANGPAGSR